jgi:uncharacterized protein (TIGR03083 family)
MRLPLNDLLVVRAFELWIHDNDIRAALGRPPSIPDASTLQLMTDLTARVIPRSAARAGSGEPVNLHLVLTGPGGGSWDVAAGEAACESGFVRIVADAVQFCRLAANRITPADLAPDINGDRDQGARVLAAVAALALD